MKQGWEIKKLEDVLVKTETVDPSKKPNDEFIYLDVSSVNKETKEIENASVLLGKDAPSRARKLVRTNDVIFATVRPTHSRVALITEEYNGQVCSTGYFVLRGKDFIFNQYLFYFLLTDEFNEQMQKLQKGASYPAVTDAEVKSILLRFPKSLPEQKRIVSILDEAFAAIAKAKANAEQNLKNAKELFESYLQGVFENGKLKFKNGEWEKKTLGEVCNVIGGGTPSKKNSKFYNGDIYWATVRDMKGEIIVDTEHKITKDAVKNSSTNIIPKGNVIIATRVGLGKVCLIENDTAINQDLRGIVPINPNKLSVDFLYRWFKSISQKIIEEGTGATVQGVKLPFIKSLVIYVPPLKEQQTIVQKLDALSTETKKLEAIYQQKMNDLEELKKSVLQKAFSGGLNYDFND